MELTTVHSSERCFETPLMQTSIPMDEIARANSTRKMSDMSDLLKELKFDYGQEEKSRENLTTLSNILPPIPSATTSPDRFLSPDLKTPSPGGARDGSAGLKRRGSKFKAVVKTVGMTKKMNENENDTQAGAFVVNTFATDNPKLVFDKNAYKVGLSSLFICFFHYSHLSDRLSIRLLSSF